jgi:hypothetical protein
MPADTTRNGCSGRPTAGAGKIWEKLDARLAVHYPWRSRPWTSGRRSAPALESAARSSPRPSRRRPRPGLGALDAAALEDLRNRMRSGSRNTLRTARLRRRPVVRERPQGRSRTRAEIRNGPGCRRTASRAGWAEAEQALSTRDWHRTPRCPARSTIGRCSKRFYRLRPRRPTAQGTSRRFPDARGRLFDETARGPQGRGEEP